MRLASDAKQHLEVGALSDLTDESVEAAILLPRLPEIFRCAFVDIKDIAIGREHSQMSVVQVTTRQLLPRLAMRLDRLLDREARNQVHRYVLQVGERTRGILVDAISDILTVSRDAVKPPPDVDSGLIDQQYLSGLVTAENRMVFDTLEPNFHPNLGTDEIISQQKPFVQKHNMTPGDLYACPSSIRPFPCRSRAGVAFNSPVPLRLATALDLPH